MSLLFLKKQVFNYFKKGKCRINIFKFQFYFNQGTQSYFVSLKVNFYVSSKKCLEKFTILKFPSKLQYGHIYN